MNRRGSRQRSRSENAQHFRLARTWEALQDDYRPHVVADQRNLMLEKRNTALVAHKIIPKGWGGGAKKKSIHGLN